MNKNIDIVLILTLLFLPSHSWAADDEESKVVMYEQKTEIDFDDLEIEGTLQRPQSTLVLERKRASFNPLVKLRTDWNDAIEESTEEVK